MQNSTSSTNDIEILNFIFHVVHHGDDEPILMESTPLGSFNNFFRNRIYEVLNGNKFFFTDTSVLLGQLLKIDQSIQRFSEVSKEIAIKFHEQQDGRIKPGVMILMKVLFHGAPKYIIIKYDHENVLTYVQRGNSAILREISNTFSKNKTALQKSAIISLDDPPYSIVLDKSDRKNITNFFKGFLGVKRKYSEEVLTEKLRKVFLSTVKKHQGSLSNEITSRASNIFYDFIQSTKTFEREEFLPRILGSEYSEKMEKTFKSELKKEDIEGEEFSFNQNLSSPSEKRYSTAEGVKIRYPDFAEDTVEIDSTDTHDIITITTSKLLEEHASNKNIDQ